MADYVVQVDGTSRVQIATLDGFVLLAESPTPIVTPIANRLTIQADDRGLRVQADDRVLRVRA